MRLLWIRFTSISLPLFEGLLLSIYFFRRFFLSFAALRVHFCPFYICLFLYFVFFFVFFTRHFVPFLFSIPPFFWFHSRLFRIQIFSSYFICCFLDLFLAITSFFLDFWWVFFRCFYIIFLLFSLSLHLRFFIYFFKFQHVIHFDPVPIPNVSFYWSRLLRFPLRFHIHGTPQNP